MKIIFSESAPAPIGPYSQAISIAPSEMIFCSGQIPLLPDGSVLNASVAEQTRLVIQNIQAVLAAAGATLSNVVKTTVFLKDMNTFAEMNGVYAEYFGESKPARSTVEVARLPKDVLVEIEVLAIQ